MMLPILQGRGHGRDGELPGRRVSLSKSTHHSSEAGSLTLQAAMPTPSLVHSPRHTGHRKDAASPPHAPSPCRATAKAGALGPWGHRLDLGHLEA